ncbi:MAG TPA: efflux RND transporter periplasmic adaptor subunit [Gemmatimonadaceae bacterium]|nr:efflux RND transporter periplasmic adaptor subunit [Gemmatimonadaceae bacterium]
MSLAVALVVPVLPVVLGACAKKSERPPRPVATVSVVNVRRASVPYMIEANGVVVPLQSVAVSAQVDGLILSVDFQEGQEVRAGEPLFHIDPRLYQNAYDQATAVYSRDSATAANAKTELERVQKLLASKVITPQEASVQQTTAATSEATVRGDQANIANARFNLENTVIRAPIAGKTGGLLVRKGNLVRAGGATPLVLINQVRPIMVRFSIPSSQLGLILQYGAQGGLPVAAVAGGLAPASPSIDSLAAAATMNPVQDPAGQSGSMRPTAGGGSGGSGGGGRNAGGTDGVGSGGGGSPGGRNRAGAGGSANGSAALAQGPIIGERTMGKLSFIDNAVDTTTGTVQLRATFDNSNGRLWAGQFASTSLHLYDEDSALVIPVQAVVTGQRGSYVYIVDQSDTARQRAVTVERTAGGLAIISNGVREGDRVVLDGQSRLTPDAPVKLRSATDATGNGGAGGGRRGGGKGGRRGGKGGAANAPDGAAAPAQQGGAQKGSAK